MGELEALVGDVDPMDVEGTREERAFKLWIKSMDIDTDVYDLSADLKSGVALLELEDKVEEGVVSWERVNKAKDGKKLHVMKLIENCNLACSVARHMGLVIVGIDGNDIATGASLKLSLAILWQLSFKHAQVEMKKSGKTIEVAVWHGKRAELAKLRTVCSHIENMITGVTRGYVYKLRFVYAHFPINGSVSDNKDKIEVVSLGAAMIQQSTTVHNKDIRKFLDGVYVSE